MPCDHLRDERARGEQLMTGWLLLDRRVMGEVDHVYCVVRLGRNEGLKQ